MKNSIYKLSEATNFKGCVLAYGHFSSIHPGHIRYLQHAKEQGQKLVVAILGDGLDPQAPKYPFNQKERAESLSMIDVVDAIILLDNDIHALENTVKVLKPDLLILGKEFEQTLEEDIINSINFLNSNGKLTKFHAGDIKYANSDLLNATEKELTNEKRKEFINSCKKQKLDLALLLKSIDSWKSTRVIVIGDTIVDQYAACEAIGMSAEAPVVVVKELDNRNFIGGAAIVASHIRALGANCDFISIVGNDDTANLVKKELKRNSIAHKLIVDSSRPTTFKKRYIVGSQKLFRVSRLEDHSIDEKIEDQLIKELEHKIPNANGIIISDFVYGVITKRILKRIYSLAQEYNIMLFGDVQCSSQIGLITKFKNFNLLCPNEKEARLALQDKESGLELLSKKLLSITSSERLIMKLGAGGFIAYDRLASGDLYSQFFPALSVNPVDVSGAGDSLLAVMATGLSNQQSMMSTAALGCCMASLAVEKMGNAPISSHELKHSLKQVLNS